MKALDLIFAARPLLHLPIWSIFLVSLHYHHQLSGGKFGFEDFGMLVMLSLLVSSAYYVNQIFDYESDKLNGKVGFLERGLLNERLLVICTVCSAVAGIAVSFFYTKTIIAIALHLTVLGLLYSIPPLRLKDRPLPGWFANALGYGFLVPFTVMPEMNLHNAGHLGWDNPFYFFCAVGGVYVLTTLSDIRGDAATGKKTIAVTIGRTRSYLLVILQFGAAAWLGYESEYYMLMAIAIGSLAMSIAALLSEMHNLDLLATKLPILLLTLAAGWWYPWYFLFIVAMITATRLYYKYRFGMIYPRLA